MSDSVVFQIRLGFSIYSWQLEVPSDGNCRLSSSSFVALCSSSPLPSGHLPSGCNDSTAAAVCVDDAIQSYIIRKETLGLIYFFYLLY
jgi:hypothetical protein